MPSRIWSVQDAKNNFSGVIEAAKREPQTVTKHGKPAVVIVDAGTYARLQDAGRHGAPRFGEHLLAMPTDDGHFERLDAALRDEPL